MDNKYYKTVVCKYYNPSSGEGCKNGSKCTFIHGDETTTNNHNQMDNKYYKTVVCKYYNPSSGEGCKNGSKCTFIHGDKTTINNHNQIDNKYYDHSRGGGCKHGNDTTKNIHREEEYSHTTTDNHNYLKGKPIIILVVEIINGYPVFGKDNGKIIGIYIPIQSLFQGCSSENYVIILNYLTEKGYKIISLRNHKEEKIIIHMKKQNTTTHHFSSSENNEKFKTITSLNNKDKKQNTTTTEKTNNNNDKNTLFVSEIENWCDE